MPFPLEAFARVRPYLYHLSARSNASRIRRTQTLSCAAELLSAGGLDRVIRSKRAEGLHIEIDNERVHIRDQAPLYSGNVLLQQSYSFEDLIANLNSRVFFWPGTASGPNSSGQRHFSKYRGELPVVLRVPFLSALKSNPGGEPLFSKYNSGSPRCSGGKGSPRGTSTFVLASVAKFTPSVVVEVTFLRRMLLPADTQIGEIGGNFEYVF